MSRLDDDPVHAIPATRALRRSRGRWRLLAFLAIAIAIIAAALRFAPDLPGRGDHIARVEIGGTITSDYERQYRLEQLAADERVKAVLVAINSPGGTTVGGEELYRDLLTLSDAKPVVAMIDELGASAAYMTALGAQRIYARQLSIVGSIGVLYQHVNAGKLLETIGIDLEKVASGELKAEPDFDEPISPQVRRSLETLVENSFSWFVDIVAAERGLERSAVLTLADGRIMTGAMAAEAGLVDAIGGQREAIEWLEAESGVAPDLPVRLAWPPPSRENWLSVLLGRAADMVMGAGLERAMALDGLVSLWHPSGTE